MATLKIVLKGAAGVGKTSITAQFVNQVFDLRDGEVVIEPDYTKTISMDGESYELELLDIPDDYHMESFFTEYGDGFLLVYSISDSKTLEDAISLRDEIVRVKKSNKVPIVLIGNKRDLAESERVVEEEEGAELAAKWPHCRFMETTAKEFSDVEKAFELIVREIIEVKMNRSRRNSRKCTPCCCTVL